MHPDIKLPIAWIAATAATDCAGAVLCLPMIAIQIQHPATLSEALVNGLANFVIIAVVMFLPTLLHSLFIALYAFQALRHRWPAWTTYAASAATVTIIFLAMASFFQKPIPDQLFSFNPPENLTPPNVHRPALSPKELPLLTAALLAALAGAHTTRRILGPTYPPPQNPSRLSKLSPERTI